MARLEWWKKIRISSGIHANTANTSQQQRTAQAFVFTAKNSDLGLIFFDDGIYVLLVSID